jgi:phenylacetic acid degradation operon negative regulatory protein
MLQFEHPDPAAMTARGLILSLMNAIGTEQMSTAQLVSAGKIFGLEASAVRMAATRLIKEGLLASAGRGRYVSGPGAAALRNQVRGWRQLEERRRPWSGEWLAVLTGNLGRTDRRRLAQRTQALRLNGFAEAEPDLWIRPANLALSLGALRDELITLGLDQEASLIQINDYLAPSRDDFSQLWDAKALQAEYRKALDLVQRSTTQIGELTAIQAARETLLLGQAVIRLINLDPLLPEEMVDGALMRTLIDEMKRYDRLGKRCWRDYYAEARQGLASPFDRTRKAG